MYGNSKLPKADKYIKKHKKLKLWHRLLLIAGSFVVFITTYMLILPAITAEIGTLAIYDEALSSGGAVIEDYETVTEETTENEEKATEATSEEIKEDGNGAGTGGSGSGGSGSTILTDGTVVNITLEKVETDKITETNSLFGNVLSLAAQNTEGLSIKYYGSNRDETFVAVYDPETGDFNVNLNIDFTLPQNLLVDYSGTIIDDTRYTKYYSLKLPAGVIIPENMVYNDDTRTPIYNGYKTGTGEVIFVYTFIPVKDSDGNFVTDENGNKQYDAVMVFDDDYLNTLNGGDIVGTMHIGAYLSSKNYTEDGSIIITDDTFTEPIEIKFDQIEFPDNETVKYDVMVKKNGSYNPSDNTITYTVRVLTQKGTSDPIKITDCFTDSSFLTSLGAKLTNIEYKQGIVGLDSYGNISEDSTTYTDSTELSQTNEGTGYYDDNGNLIITLPKLEPSDGEQYDVNKPWLSDFKNANAYCITYTYSISPEADAIYIGDNTAKAEIEDETAHTIITDTDTATVRVTGNRTIIKTGSYDSNNEIITWTITVGDGNNSVNGYILYDDMFADLNSTDEITITNTGGEIISSDKYEIVYSDDGVTISGIKFISGEDEVIQYVVTYKTERKREWSYQNVTNKADLENPDGETFSDTATVRIDGLGDCFTKKFDQALKHDDGTYTLNWTTTFSVPKSGISAGITFTDILDGLGHYMTAEEAIAVKNALVDAWGNHVIKDIQFYSGSNRWNMDPSLWVDADSIDTGDTVTKYYQFRYTVAQDIAWAEDGNNIISYSYKTTANVLSGGKDVDTITYYNTISDSNAGIAKTASWSYYKEVVKYGTDINGNLSSYSDTKLTVADGKVSWIVRVVLTPGQEYTITDTLPEGVTLKEIFAVTNHTNCNTQLALSENAQIELTNGVSGKVVVTYNDTDEDNNVIITAKNDATNRNMLYIKYVCQIDKSAEESGSNGGKNDDGTVSAGSSAKEYILTNTVKVTENGNKEYGSDDQTTTVTWQDEDDSSNTLTKNQQFDEDNNVIHYSLNINPSANIYVTSSGENYSDLVVTDTLTYYSFPSTGYARDASLILNSVSLYYAKTDEEGNVLRDANGNLIKGNKLSSNEYTWTYDVKVDSYTWQEFTTKTITLTVPNGTALVFEYDFLVKIIKDEDAVSGSTEANVTNSATITVGGETISSVPGVTTTDKVEESGTSASAHGAAGYTIYKVDENNFSMPLENAKFDLYVWSKAVTDEEGNVTEEAGFKKVDTFTTGPTGYTGISGALKKDAETEESYYEITLSDGSTYNLPVDTICYFTESEAPEGYETDKTTKYYFYYGSSVAKTLNSVLYECGYLGDEISSAINLITSHTQYVTNAHSWEYYAEKTSISVVKRWLDSTGNDITKNDGSISFQLFRVFTDVNGVQGPSPSGSGDGGSSGKQISSITVKYGPSYDYPNYRVDYGSEVIKVKNDASATVDIAFTNLASWGKNAQITIVDWDTGEVLATNESGSTDGWNGDTYTYTLDVGNKDRKIYFCYGQWLGPDGCKVDLSSNNEYVEETTEEVTEITTSSAESTTTAFYYHIFEDDYYEIITSSEGSDTEVSKINDDKLIYKGASDETYQNVKYFTINGSLSRSHGTTYWDLNGDGLVSPTDELLKTCLKMESKYGDAQTPTNIEFTANEDGVLTLVFNKNGNGNESSSIINGVYIDGEQYTASNNVITAHLKAGVHNISRSSYCFLFYMSFEEGIATSSTTNSEYIHNFDKGTSSTFYTIIGSTANNKGVVTYENLDITTCLKMNSKATITFTTYEAGTLYLILTNPNNAAVVGVVIDGVTHYATPTGEYTDNGYAVYEITARISEGEHTIKRVNSTEVMLYYIECVPDDFGSGDITGETPINEFAELLGTYEISATNKWSWSNTNLLWQVLDNNGNLLGYYSYYVVEVDNNDYITQYLNSNSDGIQSGSIAIYNQDKSESSTAISVVKKWLNSDGLPLSNYEENSIAFTLFARVTIYDDYKNSYMGGTDYSRYITDTEVSKRDYDNEGNFFNISGSRPYNGISSSQYGTAKYGGVTYTNSIKTDSNFSVKFTSPATSGILTLVFGKNNQKGDPSQGYGFAVDMPSGDNYRIAYADGTLTVYKNGTGSNNKIYEGVPNGFSAIANDPNISMISVDYSDDGVVFTIFTGQAGDYNVIRNSKISSNQSYLFYMDFSYQYQYLVEGEGIYTGDYTITSGEGWTKAIAGLPYLIYDDDGTEIGYYSYYVEETSPNEGYITTYKYTPDADGKVDNDTITGGNIEITNQQRVISVELPETGGRGTRIYTIGGILLLGFAACLLYIRKINKGEIN